MNNPSFIHFKWKNDLLYDTSHTDEPIRLYAVVGEQTFHFKRGCSYYLYLYSGVAYIKSAFPLLPGYFSVCNIDQDYVTGNEQCKLLIIERINKSPICSLCDDLDAPFLLGGPIEHTGRLKYIDGCTDSLLIAPWQKGQACLNHLHFPAGIDQTPHTHPSIRIGVVARGHGECVTPFGNTLLTEGMIFAILPANGNQVQGLDCNFHDEGTHSFRTTDSTMDVIAFHPDSDFGPTHGEHPMINRTIIDGISAKHIDEIRTK